MLGLRKEGPNARVFRWSLLVGFIGALCMMGSYDVFYRLVAAVTPIGWFRAPGRYGVFVALAMAIGAATAMQTLQRARAGETSLSLRAMLPLTALPVASVLAVALTGWPHAESAGALAILSDVANTDAAAVAAGPVLVVAALVLLAAAIRGARWALAGIVLFAAVDLGVYGVSFVRSGGEKTLEAIKAGVAGADTAPESRILDSDFSGDAAILNGWKLVDGYVGLPPKKQLSYGTVDALRLALCRDVAGAADAPVHFAPLPRVRMVCRAVVSQDPAAAIVSIDIATTAVVPRDPGLESGLPGSARLARDLPGDITIETDAVSRQMLVVSESYHRGWRATIDGAPATVVPAYGDFIGIAVDKGRHTVRLAFRPDSLRYGKLLTAAGLVLTALAALVPFIRTRPRIDGR
jgi:hypothetical protein